MVSVTAAPLEIGSSLPKLKGVNQDGKEVELKAAEGNPWLVIFTYPKAMTGGCTSQACSVRDVFEELTEKKVTVFGLSTDDPEAQKKFQDKNKLPYDLIADPKGKLAKQLGVPLVFGKLTARRALLFKDGKLVWKDDEGSTRSQGAELLEAMETNR